MSRENLGEEEDPGTPKPRTGRYSLENLAAKWDDTPEIRERLRQGNHLLRHWCNQKNKETNEHVSTTVANIKCNYPVLKPVLKLMKENGHLIPVLDNAMQEVRTLFQRCKLQFNGDRVYHEAWALRRLVTLAKSQLWKDRTPKEQGCPTYFRFGFEMVGTFIYPGAHVSVLNHVRFTTNML